MSDRTKAERLAESWIQGWIEGRPDEIPLADDFVHTSPFGTIAGRETYLERIKPASEQNVASLTILKTLGSNSEAVVRFDMATPHGTIPCVDWVTVQDDVITRIHSFYDATLLRPDAPASLSD